MRLLRLLIVGVMLWAMGSWAHPIQARSTAADSFGWQLSTLKVVSEGTTTQLPEGTLIMGYKVQAVAVATDPDSPVRRGKFEMEMSVFSPAKDMPGQKAGLWYVSGKWTITDAAAKATVTRVRHNTATISGTMLAELTANPLTDATAWEASFQIPMSLTGGRWTKGEGMLLLNFGTKSGNAAMPDVDRRPALKAQEGK